MIDLDQGGLGWAWSRVRPPPPSVARLVQSVWSQEPPQSSSFRCWRIVPDAAAHVLYQRSRPDGTRCRGRLLLVGPRNTFRDIDRRGRQFTVGATLRPGALPAFFRVPAHALADRSVALEELAAPGAARLRSTLERASGAADAAAALAAWLGGLAPEKTDVEPRVLALMERFGSGEHRSVGDACTSAGLSSRRVRVLCREHVGLTPKRAQRILRAHRTLRSARTAGDGSSTAIANGYHDESHMIRDITDLFGESPRRFLRRGEFRFLQS